MSAAAIAVAAAAGWHAFVVSNVSCDTANPTAREKMIVRYREGNTIEEMQAMDNQQ